MPLRSKGESSPVVEDISAADSEALAAEIGRLRGMIHVLEERVRQLDTLAHQDTLIELPNRRGFLRQLERLIDRVGRYGDHAALLFVDIDGLKTINDSFGHKAGDMALIQVAELLSGGVRRSDTVARLGGDEFGVLLDQANEATAQETARRLVDRIADCEFGYDGHRLGLSVAIGIGMIQGGDTPEDCIARADLAMYEAKTSAAA
jgi:diguanylate cyclase (GGDEF)-like protein